MKNIKRILLLTSFLLLMFSLCSCSSEQTVEKYTSWENSNHVILSNEEWKELTNKEKRQKNAEKDTRKKCSIWWNADVLENPSASTISEQKDDGFFYLYDQTDDTIYAKFAFVERDALKIINQKAVEITINDRNFIHDVINGIDVYYTNLDNINFDYAMLIIPFNNFDLQNCIITNENGTMYKTGGDLSFLYENTSNSDDNQQTHESGTEDSNNMETESKENNNNYATELLKTITFPDNYYEYKLYGDDSVILVDSYEKDRKIVYDYYKDYDLSDGEKDATLTVYSINGKTENIKKDFAELFDGKAKDKTIEDTGNGTFIIKGKLNSKYAYCFIQIMDQEKGESEFRDHRVIFFSDMNDNTKSDKFIDEFIVNYLEIDTINSYNKEFQGLTDYVISNGAGNAADIIGSSDETTTEH